MVLVLVLRVDVLVLDLGLAVSVWVFILTVTKVGGAQLSDEQTMSASQEYAVIRPLFCSLLCVPASSASVESVFSQAGVTVSPHRAKTGDAMLELLVYLRCNGS